MSENQNTNNPEEDDDGGLFCQKLNPCLRKVLYYLTFGIGAILFLIGCVVVFFGSEGCVIAGSVLILIAPFWIKSLKKCFLSFKDLIKLTSFLIYFVFFVLLIIAVIAKWSGAIIYVVGIGLAVSGIWYFLTFIPNGQKACIACMRSCCGKDK